MFSVVLSEEQKADFQRRVKKTIAGVPGIAQPFVSTALGRIDDGVQDVPESLRDAKVGDVIDAYLEMRRKHII